MPTQAKLRWCLPGDPEGEDLAFVKALAQLEVFEGYPARYGLARLPIGVAGVDGDVQIVPSRARGFFQYWVTLLPP